ncbi:MAG: 4-alpha-glucanotransferase [Geobacteraceae bacterium GWC2_53_11]|nr:MAG: 4-alpha-glucanotransferase [Geobacteraceae bacterium GWC2_53_11]
MLNRRGCGVLLHPTSLPGAGGIGTLGNDARRFVDLLASMGMSYWQVLPLTPPACGNSPYSSFSAFAGNPLLIDLDQIVADGDLSAVQYEENPNETSIDFESVSSCKLEYLRQAATAFLNNAGASSKQEFWDFCNTTPWLHYYALFMALKQRYKGRSWDKWPSGLALLSPDKYEKSSVELGAEIGIQKYIQWQFFRQWRRLRRYAAGKGIAIVGDIPIFVAYDSVDVWSNRELFLLDPKGKPTVVAGVPPDYFSKTGQLWGNPLYNWDVMGRQKYVWWVERFRSMLDLFDIIRVDHFRGFEAAWHVPVGEKTAVNGTWTKAPGGNLFDAVFAALGKVPVIAEDLGIITPEVVALRDRYDFPGMKILQFAFDSGPSNAYLPHNHHKNSIVYTGTHDNDTTRGWYSSLSDTQKVRVSRYVGSNEVDTVEAILRTTLMSVADTTIFPFQDLLFLGSEARMNVPGTAFGNWGWRFTWSMICHDLASSLRNQIECYGRCNPGGT